MGINNIEKKSLGYKLLWHYTYFWHSIIFYKKVYILNAENIPTDKPVIFTGNHQNALMDALALLFSSKRELIFLTRADIFKKKSLASILYYLKMLPIFRKRDGVDTIKKNESIFQRTVEVISSGSGLAILPEGNHEGVHRLRTLKKGFARIAFQTEEANNFSLDIHIMPAGIEYSNYEEWRSTLIIDFGQPIPVRDYYKLFQKEPVLAINAIKDKLSERIKEVMLNIESEKFYDLIDQLRKIYRDKMCSLLSLPDNSPPNALKADKTLAAAITSSENQQTEQLTGIEKKVHALMSMITSNDLTNEIIKTKPTPFINLAIKFILLIISLPLFLYGLINNFMPYYIALSGGNKMKDPQFRSSIKFALAIILTPIIYILQSILFHQFSPQLYITLIYFISIPLSGIFAWTYKTWLDRFTLQWRYFIFSKRRAGKLNDLLQLRDEIILDTDKIVSPYLQSL